MKDRLVSVARTLVLYVIELVIFYGFAFAFIHMVDSRKAVFYAGLSSFFVLCACLVGRPLVPHILLNLFGRPLVLLMFVVVVGFGVLGAGQPDFSVVAPGFALVLLGAALADRLEKSRRK
jgi:hypothetical protein